MGPSWQIIAVAAIILAGSLLSVIVGLVANFAKTLGQRVSVLESEHAKLEKVVIKEYHTKDEIRRLLQDLQNSILAIHTRLDRAGYPHTHTGDING